MYYFLFSIFRVVARDFTEFVCEASASIVKVNELHSRELIRQIKHIRLNGVVTAQHFFVVVVWAI
jgi:hypothetical protein